MIRLLLSIYMMVVVAWGPGVCCCAWGGLLVSNGQARKTQEEETGACCQHAGYHDADQGLPTNPQHAPGCPCQFHEPMPVVFMTNPWKLLTDHQDEQHTVDWQSTLAFIPAIAASWIDKFNRTYDTPHSEQTVWRSLIVFRC